MQVEIDKSYERNDGTFETIAGLANHPPIDGEKIYWSNRGNWYSESGRFVLCGRSRGHYLAGDRNPRNLFVENNNKR